MNVELEVGLIVLYCPSHTESPLPASIERVWNERRVDLLVLFPDGVRTKKFVLVYWNFDDTIPEEPFVELLPSSPQPATVNHRLVGLAVLFYPRMYAEPWTALIRKVRSNRCVDLLVMPPHGPMQIQKAVPLVQGNDAVHKEPFAMFMPDEARDNPETNPFHVLRAMMIGNTAPRDPKGETTMTPKEQKEAIQGHECWRPRRTEWDDEPERNLDIAINCLALSEDGRFIIGQNKHGAVSVPIQPGKLHEAVAEARESLLHVPRLLGKDVDEPEITPELQRLMREPYYDPPKESWLLGPFAPLPGVHRPFPKSEDEDQRNNKVMSYGDYWRAVFAVISPGSKPGIIQEWLEGRSSVHFRLVLEDLYHKGTSVGSAIVILLFHDASGQCPQPAPVQPSENSIPFYVSAPIVILATILFAVILWYFPMPISEKVTSAMRAACPWVLAGLMILSTIASSIEQSQKK